MTLHTNISGTWTQVQRPYVKRAGVWAPVKEAWVKRSGAWVRGFEWDTTPSSPPELSLSVTDGRYLLVETRLPELVHDPDLALIRIMIGSTEDTYPTSQYGSVYVSTKDNDFPYEPWSDYYFNNYGSPGHSHSDSSVPMRKQYPPNPTDSTSLAGGRYYRFSAWSMDLNGNWSTPTQAAIFMPKGTTDTDTIVRRAQFDPIAGGNVRNNVYYDEPMSNHGAQDMFYFYNGQMAESFRSRLPVLNITQAQVLLYRKNDSGEAMANVYMFWHNRDTAGWSSTTNAIHDVTYIGQIAKGQAKWFSIPATIVTDLASEAARGIGFYWKNPTAAAATAADYLELYRPGEETGATVSGRMNIVWTESPS